MRGLWFFMPELEARGTRCAMQIRAENSRRRVTGYLDEECGHAGIPIFLEHSPPWGNWGVNSNHGSRRDAFQWPGWKHIPPTRWLQWSACTKGRFAPPHARYYNDNGNRSQKASPDDTRTHANRTRLQRSGRTCSTLFQGSHAKRDQYMKLYELDAGGFPCGGDDFVTKLRFGTVRVPITCQDSWRCSGTFELEVVQRELQRVGTTAAPHPDMATRIEAKR